MVKDVVDFYDQCVLTDKLISSQMCVCVSKRDVGCPSEAGTYSILTGAKSAKKVLHVIRLCP